MDSATGQLASPSWGCPIRTSPDHSLLAAPRSFSQPSTSFIGPRCQGIHRAPLLARRLDLSTTPSRQDQSSHFTRDRAHARTELCGPGRRPCLLSRLLLRCQRAESVLADPGGPAVAAPALGARAATATSPSCWLDKKRARHPSSRAGHDRTSRCRLCDWRCLGVDERFSLQGRAAPRAQPRPGTIDHVQGRPQGQWSRGDSNP